MAALTLSEWNGLVACGEGRTDAPCRPTSTPAAQYVGDTAFGFTVRVFGTFIGAVAGLLIWTIAAGTGIANPYALAATCAVAFPILMFVRSYYQPPIAAILPIVTTMLVLGYSFQDSHSPALSSVGWGWDVAWRRQVPSSQSAAGTARELG